MRTNKVLLKAFAVQKAVVEDVELEEGPDGLPMIVLHVRPRAREALRCPHCRHRCGRYDLGAGRRRWRAPDGGFALAFVEADAPRVQCKQHGVVVADVPWAHHASKFTTAFEELVAWLVTRMDRTSLAELMRVSWRTVTAISGRVVARAQAASDPLDGLVRIGIDEVSYRKGHRYLTVVVDHDSGRLLWAAKGHSEATLEQFFERLGDERADKILLVSADAASWIRNVVERRCPNAIQCMDAFHIVQWATKALDEVRREVWNKLRRSGKAQLARSLKNSRWALWKDPAKLTPKQRKKLSTVEAENAPLYRAYLLKEQLRQLVRQKGAPAMEALDGWLSWASRSRLQPFVKLGRTIRAHRREIDATLAFGLSNARVEGANTRIRVLHRMAFGFHSHQPLIMLAMLKLGGLQPNLPGRI